MLLPSLQAKMEEYSLHLKASKTALTVVPYNEFTLENKYFKTNSKLGEENFVCSKIPHHLLLLCTFELLKGFS